MKAIGPLVGFVMRETKGRADGGEVRRLILERLGALISSGSGARARRPSGTGRRNDRGAHRAARPSEHQL